MNCILRYGVVVSALVMLAGCEDKKRLLKVDSSPLVAPHRIDFGMIPLHGRSERVVKLLNAGRAPMVVSALDVGLTGADRALSADGKIEVPFAAAPVTRAVPITLTTGETTEISLSFAPRVAGPIHGVLSVKNDSTEEPDLTVELVGLAVDAQARISPGQLDFGKIEVGSKAVQGISVVNDSPLPVQVTPTGVGQDTDAFSAHVVTVPAHSQRQMPVTFAPSRLGKVISALSITRCEGCLADQINLFGEGIDSAMVVDPDPMDFGAVPIDNTGHVSCRLINVSSVPLELRGVAMGDGASEGFKLEQDVPDYVLPPGAWLATSASFTPTHLGESHGSLRVSSASKRHPILTVPLIGRGGGAQIVINPSRIDFGQVPVGGGQLATVHITNSGSGTDILTVHSGTVAGTGMGLDPQAFPLALAAGQTADLTLSFSPDQSGAAAGALVVTSSDGSARTVTVPLTGTGKAVPACNFDLAPASLDFGNVAPGSGAVLGIRFTNQGTDVCGVREVKLDRTAGGAFFMPGGPLRALLLYPGDSFQTQIAFQPRVLGVASGSLQLHVSNPARPVIEMPIIGRAEQACLTAAPNFIDFGALRRDCSHAHRSTRVVNACNLPISVGAPVLGAGTSNEFSLVGNPGARVLSPGAGFTTEVAFSGQQLGQNFTPLFVPESDTQAPLLVPLLGEGLPDGSMTDHFVQESGTKADVLFVVDNSASPTPEQGRLLAAIPSFITAARQRNMDLHVAVTTTGLTPVTTAGCNGGVHGGEAGRLFPADGSAPRIIDLSHPAATQELEHNVQAGWCTVNEEGLEAMRLALSSPLVDRADDPRTPQANDGNLGFLRDDAQLSVVVVTDEDDHSGFPVEDYAAFLRSVHGLTQPQRSAFFGIVPLSVCSTSTSSSAPRYSAVAAATGGATYDVCQSDYAPVLAQIAGRAFGPQDHFPLTQLADGSSVVVTVDGVTLPRGAWNYDAGTNSVIFNSAPAAGSKVDIGYREVCPP
jgi:hypothetical protein